jgi:Na+-transporting NADH:ubiquinone oxidoreductase subunit F
VGAQVLLWTISGVAFAWLDPGAVEGAGLIAHPASRPLAAGEPIADPATVLARYHGQSIRAFGLERVDGTWVYRIERKSGVELRRAADGTPFRIDEPVARRLALAHYRGTGRLAGLRLSPRAMPEVPAAHATWRADFGDASNTRLYFAADDGAFIAVRTDAWRLQDVFWRLHTLDYSGRRDFNHPLIVFAAAAALWVAATGAWLLWRVFTRRDATRS